MRHSILAISAVMALATQVRAHEVASADTGSLSNAAAPRSNPDQAESDAAYSQFDSFRQKATPSEAQIFPAQFQCGDEKLNLGELYDPRSGTDRIFTSPSEPEYVVVNLTDGDQVEELKMKRADLKALKEGTIHSFSATEMNGYWWADGDHVKVRLVKCHR
jgi:hypothetical protein